MSIDSILYAIEAKVDLDSQQASSLMEHLVSGKASDHEIRGVLLGINEKGVTGQELAEFARVLRRTSLTLSHDVPGLLDTCGTGGGRPSFNLSTAAAIVACAAGAKVAKHGNRGVTSKCGSADVLEELGVRLTNDAEALTHILDTVGMVFLFAQNHHPAMRHVGPVRRELGVRTVFNLLGPLSNPAGASRQLIGVYDPKFLDCVAEALLILGTERALVVHGADGMDEVSPCAETEYRLLWDGKIVSGHFPNAGIPTDAIEPADSVQQNAQILLESIKDDRSVRARAILPNAGAALWLAGVADSFDDGLRQARLAIESGSAVAKLNHLVEETLSA